MTALHYIASFVTLTLWLGLLTGALPAWIARMWG